MIESLTQKWNPQPPAGELTIRKQPEIYSSIYKLSPNEKRKDKQTQFETEFAVSLKILNRKGVWGKLASQLKYHDQGRGTWFCSPVHSYITQQRNSAGLPPPLYSDSERGSSTALCLQRGISPLKRAGTCDGRAGTSPRLPATAKSSNKLSKHRRNINVLFKENLVVAIKSHVISTANLIQICMLQTQAAHCRPILRMGKGQSSSLIIPGKEPGIKTPH